MFHAVEDGFVGIGIAVGEAFGAEVAKQAFIFYNRAGKRADVAVGGPVFLVAEIASKVDVASFEQGVCPLRQPGKFGVSVFEFTDAEQAVCGGGHLIAGQLGEQAVAVDGPEEAVGIVVALVSKGRCLKGDHALVGCAIGVALEGQSKGPDFIWPHPDKFMGPQSCVARLHPSRVCAPCPRVYPDDAFDFRRTVGCWCRFSGVPGVQQLGQEPAQPFVAVVVAGQTEILLDCPLAEVYAEYGTNAVLGSQPCEVRATCSAVHVGEGYARCTCCLGFGKQFLRAHDAVAEAEPRMVVQVHGGRSRGGLKQRALGLGRIATAALAPRRFAHAKHLEGLVQFEVVLWKYPFAGRLQQGGAV